jgi:diaminopimelate decarboxylase
VLHTTTNDEALIDLSLYPEGASIAADGRLVIGGCAVSDIADEFGTPALIVDEGALRARAREYLAAFSDRHADSEVLFASKSFPTASIVGLLAEEGCGVDVASGEELLIARSSGADAANMVLHGNAKSDFDIQSALDAKVGHVVIDNLDDVERIARLATQPVPVLVRVSPQVDASTHEKMMTGHDASKFGIPSGQVHDVLDRVRREPMLDLQGLHAHIGSGIADLDQFDAEVRALARMERFHVYNFGGGLGVRYTSEDVVPSVAEYADVLVSAVHKHLGSDVRIMVEPGRSMVARSAVTIYRVVTVKRGVRTHVAVDGGMGDNLEVALYGQPFSPSVIDRVGEVEISDVVGRHCESGDTLSRDTPLTRARVGDLVTVPVTGAYCFTMSNNYNGALRPPVLFAKDGEVREAVRRETMEDLLRRDLRIAGPS